MFACNKITSVAIGDICRVFSALAEQNTNDALVSVLGHAVVVIDCAKQDERMDNSFCRR